MPHTEDLPSNAAAGSGETERKEIRIGPIGLEGILALPANAQALVIFAHGSGSGRFSPRNQAVAAALNERGVGTLLLDLLTPEEEADRANVFDIALLAGRLVRTVHWIDEQPEMRRLSIGFFGASTGAAAALAATSELGGRIRAVVSRGGRPDLARGVLGDIDAPTLLIVGGADPLVLELNEQALERLGGPKALKVVPGATHLFPEPGALEGVIEHAASWFETYLAAEAPSG